MYKEFKDQLQRHLMDYYETHLIWKVSDPALDKNKDGSLLHLKSPLGKLKKDPQELWTEPQHYQRSTPWRNHGKGNRLTKW